MADSMKPLAITATRETVFFSRPEPAGPLRQWIEADIENTTGAELFAVATISAGGEDVMTRLNLLPGSHTYVCYAPTLWPEREPVPQAPLSVRAGLYLAEERVSVGTHRPWTICLLGDDCVDYTWAYENLAEFIADSASTTRAEIRACLETSAAPFAEQNRHNLIHSTELLFFLQDASAEEVRALVDLVRSGHISLSAYHNMVMSGNLSLPEAIRQFYPAARFAREWNLPLDCANHQETPTICWSQASLLAGAGVRHLVKSILAYDTPWNDRLAEPPIFFWEGPDGSRILVRRRNTDYVEGRFVLEGEQAIREALLGKVIPEYEGLGARYPLSVIGLVGCYGDLAPKTPTLASIKAGNIAAYNARARAEGWEYPRLVNASHEVFWRAVEDELRQCQVSLPAYRGDYGTSWEVWAASLARYFADWRRAQERATTADALAAWATWLNQDWWRQHGPTVEEGWRNLLLLSDHAWNGSSDGSRRLNASLRCQWQEAAHQSFDAAIEAGLSAISRTPAEKGEPAASGRHLLAVNTLGWERDGLVHAPAPAGVRAASLEAVAETGEVAPVQACVSGSEGFLTFVARSLPALGWRSYELRPARSAPSSRIHAAGDRLENGLYELAIDSITGAIASIWDKEHRVELVDPASPWRLNQALYSAAGKEVPLRMLSCSVLEAGPVVGTIVITSAGAGIELTSRISLYEGLDRIDIENRVHKPVCLEPEELYFAFPLNVPGRRYKLEQPGAIITPGDIPLGGQQRPGSGQVCHAVRHFIDVYNDAFGVTLSQVEAGLVQFRRVGAGEAPREPGPGSAILSLALGDVINYREVSHDQGGVTDFTFRYSLRPHDGGFEPATAVRFGAEVSNPVLTTLAVPGSAGRSLVRVSPPEVLLVELKVADEGPQRGLIARLWNTGADGVRANLTFTGPTHVRTAWLTDLVERDRCRLPVSEDETVSVQVPGQGYASIRVVH